MTTRHVATVIVESDGLTVPIQGDPELDRIIELMTREALPKTKSRKERRRWNKPAKRPKALRGRP